MATQVTVETVVRASPEKVWSAWTEPEHVTKWNAASADWHSPRATNDLRVDGRFNTRMESRDGSQGFDFEGTYIDVVPHQRIAYVMDDGRKVDITFTQEGESVKVVETFDAETENSVEMQKAGWQSIMDGFKKYVEEM
ncbi:SRPBCC family protein [Patescibacteria group bacterium]|jgi:uncharacterized protein YndB with AHSA1/START domain|nr:SRPBCC family protein [Patescibacteria group bacterium]